MILGMFILKRSYSFRKYLSVMIVTLGLIIVTLASSSPHSTSDVSEHVHSSHAGHVINTSNKTSSSFAAQQSKDAAISAANAAHESFRFLIGVSLLCFGLFTSTATGVYQEKLFSTFGKLPNEAQFYIVRKIIYRFIDCVQVFHQFIHLFFHSSFAAFSFSSLVPHPLAKSVQSNRCL
jgi:solute carrier family 35 (UDP-xylose/UDP-N-acetylglucosamine transporter), member B4